ncbi:RelA/SpoT domain-containing protein [Actinobacillus equuli subsp. haemolyticus]|uniref:RelA/SpoT domain-containing protein n=1 Tax=Actinobacillus equuli TaxID=718 RepID=UPI002441A0AF|nr:RelA/SpoT domain-containing protein [Actinobacillus equuli]WGE81006.1 RelA/SpoT domain-containing protein [Actinobacillus equuli subsp. haemolyticus]
MSEIASIIQKYESKKYLFERFLRNVKDFFELNPILNEKPFPIIHSIKSRLKEPSHLEDKINRKQKNGKVITSENIFNEITDLAGVRILHLSQEQFVKIHKEIMSQIDSGEWAFVEEPKAFTWDPEYKTDYEKLNILTELRETYYTSTHYLVRPKNNQESICCEIQVRTLFEEIWGEIDHTINYPHPTDSIACKEQLRVLAKLASTGTRLTDSIFRSLDDHKNKQE